MSNGAGELDNIPTVAENDQVQSVEPTSMVTDEDPTMNGAAVSNHFCGAILESVVRLGVSNLHEVVDLYEGEQVQKRTHMRACLFRYTVRCRLLRSGA